jgi:hypothetical protein
MAKAANYYQKVLDILKEIKKDYPSFNMGRHISTVLSEYGDAWGITDKELYFALEKYKTNLDLYDGVPISDDSEVENIIKGGLDLQKLFSDEEEEDYE